MTIRVEREALLRVISRAPSLPSSSKGPLIEGEEEFVIVELPETKQELPFLIDSNNNTTDDDQASVCSLSTSSVTTTSTTDDDEEETSPRVSFATDLVTDVWTRERTPLEDVSMLFYSSQETQMFRQEYRLERKVLNDLSIDPETFPGTEEELLELVAKATASPSSTALSSNNNAPPTSPGRHSISRVVVLHNDKLETFFNDPAPTANDVDFLSSLIAPEQQEVASPLGSSSSNSSGSDFFDNDSFWSGSLTWY